MPEQNEYRTEDLAFAAFLRVRGYALSRVEKLNPTERNSKRAFFFDVPQENLGGSQIRQGQVGDVYLTGIRTTTPSRVTQ